MSEIERASRELDRDHRGAVGFVDLADLRQGFAPAAGHATNRTEPENAGVSALTTPTATPVIGPAQPEGTLPGMEAPASERWRIFGDAPEEL